jgi:putative redox protein
MGMKETVNTRWLSDMAFESEINGHKIIIDADPMVGGQDVISILKKMRVEVDSFNVRVEGDLTEEHPKHFIKMHVIYEFTGKDLPMDKLQKAVSLSEERYCGVSASYRKAMKMTSEIKIIKP